MRTLAKFEEKVDPTNLEDKELLKALQKLLVSRPSMRLQSIDHVRLWWRGEMIRQWNNEPEKMESILANGDQVFHQLEACFRELANTLGVHRSVKEWMKLGHEAFKAKDFRQAKENFERACEEEATSADAQAMAGMAAFYLNEVQKADDYAMKALRLDREHVKAIVLKGLIHVSLNELPKAKDYFSLAHRLEPESATVIRYMDWTESKIQGTNNTAIQEVNNSGFYSKTNPGVKAGKAPVKNYKRRWVRKNCNFNMVVNDFEQMTASNAKVRQLSAGGCLLEGAHWPDEFEFCIELGGDSKIHGRAKKIYVNNKSQSGFQFMNLSPKDEDVIQRRIN